MTERHYTQPDEPTIVEVDPSGYVCREVCLDADQPVLAQYDPSCRWNGWIGDPRFSADAVVEIFEHLLINGLAEEAVSDYGCTYQFDDDGSLVIIDHQQLAEYPEEYPYRAEIVAPDEDGLYSVGGFSWVWTEPEWLISYVDADTGDFLGGRVE